MSLAESVRGSAAADAAVCAAFDAAQRAAAPGLRGGPELVAGWPPRDTASWRELCSGERDGTMCLIAELDAQPTGFAVAELRNHVVMVERIYVLPEARELGLGDAMLTQLIAWGREHEATAIEALALPGDRETKNMFERFGIKARALIVRAAIDADDDPD